ncbi:ankyrin repeat domain-containing protein [Arthrobacter nitrophenolicus]|uniref:Ankyrin repeat domain-containing protein n=1 Tax=Arthrobacter nitrophenolicus TaxID=683150 RepID=A0A4V3B1Q9_9MICC|nr:ankyrin repeat domain-containing protein [Arthrobacter nitrophenolicus]TDL37908.1 ankyrin repeat domain-containing protein [Arthrobacter nitrophenolicus]
MKRFRAALVLAAVGLLLSACQAGPPAPQAESAPAPASSVPQPSPEQPTPELPSPEQPPTAAPAPLAAPALSVAEQAQLDQELIAAAKANNVPLVAALIGRGGNVNAKDAIQDSAFLYAGAEGLNEVLRLTLAAGADASSINRYGGTALIPASEHGHVETVQILIAAGVPVNHVNNLGWTAMQEAILLNNGGPRQLEVVRLLLDVGADPDIRDPKGRTALQNADRLGFAEIAALIRSRG